MPAFGVVRRTQVASDDALRIYAGRESSKQFLRPFVAVFSKRERRGRNRHGGVTVHRHVHVVVVVRMAGGAVDQCRLLDVAAAAAADQHGLRVAAEFLGIGVQDFRQRLSRSGKRHADEVEQTLFGDGLRGRGEVTPAGRGNTFVREPGSGPWRHSS